MNERHIAAVCIRSLLLALVATGMASCKGQESPSKSESQPAGGTPGAPVEGGAAAEFNVPEVDVSALPMMVQTKIGAARREARRTPNDPVRVTELGALHYVYKLPQVAVACFKHVAQVEPTAFASWYNLGLAYEAAGDAAQAIAAYEKAISLNEKFPPTRIRLGALLLAKSPEKAAEQFRHVAERELDPNRIAALVGLAKAQAALGQNEEAVHSLERALMISPNYGPAHAAMAAVLEAQGKSAEAAQHKRRAGTDDRVRPVFDNGEDALLQQGLNVEALVRAASGQIERGQFATAEGILRKAADVEESGVMARTALAQVIGMQGRWEDAIRELENILAMPQGKDYIPAHINLAFACAQRKDLARAEQILRELLQKHPTDTVALQRFGALMVAKGTPDAIPPVLQAALAAAPDDAQVHQQVSDMYLELGRKDDAVAAARRVVELLPKYPLAWHRLGMALYSAGDVAGAREQWNEALRLLPSSIATRLALVGSYVAEKNFPEAEKLLRAGLEAAPKSADLANSLAWLLATCPNAAHRKPEEALKLAQEAAAATQNNDYMILDTLAAAYAAVGQFDEARKWVAEAIRVAESAKQPKAVAEYQARQKLYEANQPYVQE